MALNYRQAQSWSLPMPGAFGAFVGIKEQGNLFMENINFK